MPTRFLRCTLSEAYRLFVCAANISGSAALLGSNEINILMAGMRAPDQIIDPAASDWLNSDDFLYE